jgi:hypothetical protein
VVGFVPSLEDSILRIILTVLTNLKLRARLTRICDTAKYEGE